MTLYVSGYFESAASLTHYPMLKRSDTQSTFSPEDTTASSIVAEPTPRAVAVDVPGLTPMSSKRGCQHQDQHYGRQPTRQACPNCLQQVQSSPSRGIANAGRAGFDGESDSDTDSDATAADTTLGSSDTDGTSIGDATDIGVEPLDLSGLSQRPVKPVRITETDGFDSLLPADLSTPIAKRKLTIAAQRHDVSGSLSSTPPANAALRRMSISQQPASKIPVSRRLSNADWSLAPPQRAAQTASTSSKSPARHTEALLKGSALTPQSHASSANYRKTLLWECQLHQSKVDGLTAAFLASLRAENKRHEEECRRLASI